MLEIKSPMVPGIMTSSRDQLLIVISIALIFAGMSFSYSFIGFFSPQAKSIIRFDTFSSLTPQEIGGHFLFGFIIGLPFRKLRMAVLCGLIALGLDTDHILNAAGFEVQGRMSHSIPFIIIASVLVGAVANLILNYSVQDNTNSLTTRLRRTSKGENSRDEPKSNLLDVRIRNTFSQFLVITAAAVISHIAYDIFVDNHAKFPLLAPLDYSDYHIPQNYGLPIEGAVILFVCFWNMTVRENMHESQVCPI